MFSLIGQIGRYTIEYTAATGRTFLFLLSAFAWAFRPPSRVRLIIHHIRTIGVESLSVVILSGVFTGMVMGLQGYYSLENSTRKIFSARPSPSASSVSSARCSRLSWSPAGPARPWPRKSPA